MGWGGEMGEERVSRAMLYTEFRGFQSTSVVYLHYMVHGLQALSEKRLGTSAAPKKI